ncbi:protein of unknown function DUF86 [Pyrobaculum islandicum DSM 4184]|uniref:DUF86 domain-containing protein n=1 Tax=Pyrobaculum islandicum (strain DSM 4184 / JCM 9189 / GEO3) TaxID=384616 RepID=A1RUQ7_PYRIL|nr:HepT-like ribonuclease domain-containing protein [Pyrobaculum islandicum]ABL88689.1 protein of unknown function DUF86 [Pyrobaculum islandicum DSM 4184]
MFALERLAELVAQSVLDLAAMWAAAEGGEKPATYRDLAAFLARRIGGYGEFLRRLASFRNIIVHGYHQLDEASELEAFHEIVSTMPQIVKVLEAKLPAIPV